MNEQSISSSCRVRVYLLGPLEVARCTSENWQVVSKEEWGKYRKAGRRILGRLLAAPGRRAGQGRLLDDLWPENDSQGNLNNGLTAIRNVIGEDLITTIDVCYEIAGQDLVWVDLDACKTLLRTAENQGGTTFQAISLLEEALSYLERGACFEGEEGQWRYGLQAEPEAMLRQCRWWLAQGYEQQGKLWQAGEQYRAICQISPPDENALRAWMELLNRQGKRQDALRCYQKVQSFFEEQGFLLSPSIHQLATQIEAQRFFSALSPLAFFPPQQTVSSSNSPLVQGMTPLKQGIIVSKQKSEDLMDQLRRKFLQNTGALLFPLFVAPGQKNDAALDDTVSYGNNIIKACWSLMKGKEINTTEALLSAYTPVLLNLVFQPSSYQRAIAQIATQACMIRAIIAKHQLNPIAREMYCHEAIQCSRLAGDKALHSGALMYLGYTYTFCNPLRPQKAIEIFLEALKELGNVDDLVKSDICIGLADAYALVNDEYQARRTIHIAQDSFPSHPEHQTSFFYADCALDTLYQWEAKMYLDLAQHDQRQDYYKNSWTILEQSAKIHASSERCMAETVIYQATAALGLHDLDRYVSYLKEGAATALQIGSQRRFQEAFDLHQQASKVWEQEHQMHDLGEFFQDLQQREKQV